MFANEYDALTTDEKTELAEKIAGGIGINAEPGQSRDLFEITLRSGRTVSGSYVWGMELGDFEWLMIRDAAVRP